MKKYLNITLGILSFCLITFQSATASPTKNEFIPCREQATKTLEHCLIENNTHNNDDCWSDSKTAYSQCREKVFFKRMTEIRNAKKAALEKLETEQ